MNQKREMIKRSEDEWTTGKAIKKAREREGFTQDEFSNKLGISRSYLAALEGNVKVPSKLVVKNLLHTFDIREDWFNSGRGEMNSEEERGLFKKYFPTPESRAVITAVFLAPVFPWVAAGLATTAGASEIIQRLCRYHGVKDRSSLCEKLKLKRADISHWLSHNTVPQKYIDQTVKDCMVPEFLIKSKVEVGESDYALLVELVQESLEIDRKQRILKDELHEIVAEIATKIVFQKGQEGSTKNSLDRPEV